MQHDHISIALRVLTSERLAELMRRPFLDLSHLPEQGQQEVVYGDTNFVVSVWRDTLETGEHRIVVQTTNPRWMGMWAWVHAEGFAITETGERRALTDEELLPFR
jgi:hypothetical protein